jgi:hypothetical protein
MNNISNKFRFRDFTISNYTRLLELAKANHKFIFFNDERNFVNKSILLRHDVEFSVPIALQMAKIENQLSIKATYFVQLHGDFYNALEKNTFRQLKEIESLGHRLELHFDAHFWEITRKDQLERFLRIDKENFEKYFNQTPKVFSFHNNNAFTLSCEEDTYADIINVYAKRFKTAYGYCSDSTGYWRYEVLEDRLKEAKDQVLQVLIHDGMWQNEVLPPRRRIHKVIEEHASFMKQSYDDTLKNFGAKNIDWEGEL